METKEQIKMLRDLLNNGVFYINAYSTDCDGVYSEWSMEFKSEKEFLEWEESFWERAEGKQAYRVVDKEQRLESITDYTGWCK